MTALSLPPNICMASPHVSLPFVYQEEFLKNFNQPLQKAGRGQHGAIEPLLQSHDVRSWVDPEGRMLQGNLGMQQKYAKMD